MAIDFRKNKDDLDKAYRKITDNNDPTNWVVFGYEGQTTSLKVVETGDGGIEEMAEDLSSGKMLYAYCRVNDPNTSLDKYVLIHWTGESVPENVKLKYTTHLKDIQAFVKAIHVTVIARTETDIDEDEIIKKVSKASGANYSFHKEKSKPEEAPAPVGTDYKRIIPQREINLNERDKFWSQTEKDEISRQNENKTKMEQERNKIEEERKEREQREAKERDKQVAHRMKDINVMKAYEQATDVVQSREEEKNRWAQVQKESSIDEEERGHRSDNLRKQRVAEAAQLTSSSTAKSRDFFKQKSTERPDMSSRAPPPPRKIIREFGNKEQADQPQTRKEPIQLPKEDKPVFPASPEPIASPVHEPEPENEPEPTRVLHVEEVEDASQPEPSIPQTRNLLKESLPPRHHSDSEEDGDQDWDEPQTEESSFHKNNSNENPEDTQPQHLSSSSYPQQVEEEPIAENDVPTSNQGGELHGLCARALYDYQAADETEITFDPEDIISDISQIDEGWWQGTGPDGSYGMFPANYVELINGSN